MTDPNLQTLLRERFAQLPTPVQRAIFSEDISKNLRQISDARKLHLDQGEKLENEVMMALFGITPIDELQGKVQKELGVSAEIAAEISADVSRAIFEPIRQDLERELEHPEAKEKELSGVEAAREQMLGNQPSAASASSSKLRASSQPAPEQQKFPPGSSPLSAGSYPVQPATPPPPPPTEKAVRMPASGAYKPGETSVERKDIHDDPYREPPA